MATQMANKADDKAPKDEGLGLRMLKTRTVLVTGAVDDKLAERTIEKLLILEAENHDPIRVVITSQGGHVDSGMAIHDVLRFIESPVVTIGAGWVASIAVPILFGAPRERRYSLPHTRFLLHQPSGGAGGQATDIRIEAEEILKVRERLNGLIAAETGQSVERVAKDSDRNYWMDAQQALEYGLVSRVVTCVGEIG
ncbi:ATP-dependent Clp protease proteolytic subunit [Myxococcota bacterium]|nr:ATP-dependent Clp protease proteolytic subunit [Myxococcota bacterium]